MSKKTTIVRTRHRGGKWFRVHPDGREELLPDTPTDWSKLDAMIADGRNRSLAAASNASIAPGSAPTMATAVIPWTVMSG